MNEWVRKQKELLDMENCEEAVLLKDKLASMGGKVCENEGLSILNLEMIGIESTLFGRCSVEFQKIGKLPIPNGMKVGDEVDIFSPNRSSNGNDEDNTIFGLIKKITPTSITIVVDEYDDLFAEVPIRINLHPNSTTHVKMMQALDALAGNPLTLSELLYASSAPPTSDPTFNLLGPVSSYSQVKQWFNPTLNPSQQQAIQTSLRAKQISLVHGPPGTGKTSTLVELILQSIIRQERILVTAPSNIAVDTILIRLAVALDEAMQQQESNLSATDRDRLAYAKKNLVRIGHPARIHLITQTYSLDCRISTDDDTEIVRDVKKELDTLRASLSRAGRRPRNNNNDAESMGTTKREIRTELKAVRKELQQREHAVVHRILQRSSVVFATCVGAASHLLTQIDFHLVIVDEAAQALEAATWIPVLRAGVVSDIDNGSSSLLPNQQTKGNKKLPTFADVGLRHSGKVVLAGDHCQLPPTVKSETAAEAGLSITLFERMIHYPSSPETQRIGSKTQRYGYFAPVITMLNIQYRMHEVINHWASHAMYQGALLAHDTVRHHSLLDLILPSEVHPSVSDGEEEDIDCPPVMLFIDTSNTGMYEADDTVSSADIAAGSTSTKAKDTQRVISSAYSHSNVHEAVIVIEHLVRLLKRYPTSLTCRQIGLITPYNGQVQCLKRLVAEHVFLQSRRDIDELEIKTVDGFQGGEKEVILLSFVRSNDDNGRVGFLKDSRRINVAVTRTKRHFVCVGDRRTIGADDFVAGLLRHIDEYGDTVTVEMFQEDTGDGGEGGRDGGCSLRSIRRPDEEMEVSSVSQTTTVSSTKAVSEKQPVEKKSRATAANNKTKPTKAFVNSSNSSGSGGRVAEGDKVTTTQRSIETQLQQEAEKERFRVAIRRLLEALVDPAVSQAALEEACRVFSSELRTTTVSPSVSPSVSLVSVTDRGCALHFHPQLNSFQRMVIHEVADTIVNNNNNQEKLLRHQSVGDGDARHMEVWMISSLAKRISATRDTTSNTVTEEKMIDVNQTETVSNEKEDEPQDDDNGQDDVENETDPSKAVSTSSSSSQNKNKKKRKNKTKATAADQTTAATPPPATTSTSTSFTSSNIASLAAIAHLERQKQKRAQQTHLAQQQQALQSALRNAPSDDAFLDVLIARNAQEADKKKYRLGPVQAMPNYDKEHAKEKLRAKLDASQQARRVVLSEEEQKALAQKNKGKSETAKKPPPNFGGGRLGTK